MISARRLASAFAAREPLSGVVQSSRHLASLRPESQSRDLLRSGVQRIRLEVEDGGIGRDKKKKKKKKKKKALSSVPPYWESHAHFRAASTIQAYERRGGGGMLADGLRGCSEVRKKITSREEVPYNTISPLL